MVIFKNWVNGVLRGAHFSGVANVDEQQRLPPMKCLDCTFASYFALKKRNLISIWTPFTFKNTFLNLVAFNFSLALICNVKRKKHSIWKNFNFNRGRMTFTSSRAFFWRCGFLSQSRRSREIGRNGFVKLVLITFALLVITIETLTRPLCQALLLKLQLCLYNLNPLTFRGRPHVLGAWRRKTTWATRWALFRTCKMCCLLKCLL